MRRLEDKLPPFANGSVVSDYKPLLKYFELIKESGKSLEALVIREDLDFLSEIVKFSERLSLKDLLDILVDRVINRLDCSLASEAFKEIYGIDLHYDLACRKMAEIVSGWIIEIGKNLGVLILRESWRSG